MHRQLGVELDPLDGSLGTPRAKLAHHRRLAVDWPAVALDQLRAGDLMLLSVDGRPLHVGVVVDPGRRLVIHALPDAGVLVERWDRVGFAHRPLGALRHPELAHG